MGGKFVFFIICGIMVGLFFLYNCETSKNIENSAINAKCIRTDEKQKSFWMRLDVTIVYYTGFLAVWTDYQCQKSVRILH